MMALKMDAGEMVFLAPTIEYAQGLIADCWDEQERYYTVTSSDIELLEKALEIGLDAFNEAWVKHEYKYNFPGQ